MQDIRATCDDMADPCTACNDTGMILPSVGEGICNCTAGDKVRTSLPSVGIDNATATILASGGGTFYPASLMPASMRDGYMVGGVVQPSAGCEASADAVANHLATFLKRDDVADALRGCDSYRTGRYVGAWVDGSGRVILDVSECYAAKADAIHVGQARGEDAIWDNARGECIDL